MSDKHLQWDYIKAEIRSYTVQYSSYKNKQRRAFKQKLENDLMIIQNQLHQELSDLKVDEYRYVKEELEKIEEIETKGAILRSRARWTEDGEKNTKYFLNLEKKNACDKSISQLQLNDGTIIDDPKCILNEQKLFYETLYSLPNNLEAITNSEEMELKLTDANNCKLSEDEKQMCEGLVSEQECLNALKSMKNGK